jgi:chemotaxis protein MotB
MSRHQCHCEEGLAEWIMSYADMITILMAFFVVMYSMAGRDTAKEQAVLKALREQFGPLVPGWGLLLPGLLPHDKSSLIELPHKGGVKGRNQNRGGADQLRTPEGEHSRMHAPWTGDQSRVGGAVFFTDEATQLSESQKRALDLVANDIKGKPQKVEIRGHASRRAGVRSADAKDAWDEAYARCRNAMEYLVSSGIDSRRIRMSVAGDNEPLGAGGAAEPYEQNSRVEVFMLNEIAPPNQLQPWTKATTPSSNPMPTTTDSK